MGTPVERFPLFPLALVLLPHEVVPLHIFEQRYKLMIGECIEDEHEFGIVWLSDSGLKDVGCSAVVTEVVDRLDDGRMNILVTGARPFRLMRRIDDMPYPAGDIELLDEDGASAPDVAEEAHARYADLVERVTDDRPDDDDLAGLDAYAMAATVELEQAIKQDLLELRSERARLERVATVFRAALERIDETERIGEVARSNGKLR
jgi:Lon protease-like protein